MADYAEWNKRLIAYFTGSLQRGSSVFLSVDDDVLNQIGRDLPLTTADGSTDFCQAVSQYIIEGQRVNVSKVRTNTSTEMPAGIAFLAAMVLAATRMAEGEEISQLNYFGRLREVLGLRILFLVPDTSNLHFCETDFFPFGV